MKKNLLFILFSISTFSQTIKGTITDSTGVVPFVNVLIKKTESPNIIFQFTTTDENGFFSIKLKEKPELLFIEFTSLAHEPKNIYLKNFIFKENELELNEQLGSRITKLKEIILEAKVAVQVKKDTVTYDPNSFKDGTERVVEDLLKKLPGVEVKEDGEIKYKGKSIKKLLLDGDDLFESQYKIGSKNINVNMIDKVQGIENYDENSLLKGIRDSDDVVLNLVLKKGKTDLSGNANLGYGYETNLDNSISAVLVNSKIKGFGVLSHNNIGQNNTPYEIETDFQSFDTNEDQYAKSLINQGSFSSVLDSKFHRLNNNFYVNGNALIKVKKKSSLKFNFGFYDDKLNRLNQNNSYFSIANDNFFIKENNIISKKPTLYDAKLYFSNKEKTNFHWDYLSKFNFSKTVFLDNSLNNNIAQNNQVNSENLFIRQNLNSTYKLSEKKVVLTKIDYSKSNAPQNLSINPGTIIDINNSIISNNQESRFDKEFINLKSSFYSKKDSIKYVLHAEYIKTKSKFFSELKDEQNNLINNQFKNDNSYNIDLFALKPVFVINKKKYSFKVGLNSFYSKIKFNNFDTDSILENELNVNPEIYLNYKLNKNAFFSSSYVFNAVLPEEDKLFSGVVQNNYRSFSNNTFSLEFLKTHSYNLGYRYNNFFNFQQLSINLNHNYRPNNYFSNTIINENITVNNLFLASLSSKDYNLNLSGELYFHPLRTTFQFNGNYAIILNKNIVNNSDIRTVEGRNLYLNLTARVGLKSKTTLENNIAFFENSFQVLQNKTTFQSITNRTKIIYKPTKEIKIFTIANIISPDLKQNNNYLFLESEISFSPLNKNYGYSLIAKNLTNNKTFETRNISDFSSSTSSHNLIERYIMLKVYFSF